VLDLDAGQVGDDRLLVAVGESGAVLVGDGSRPWLHRDIPGTEDLYAVTWSNRLMVAGSNGTIFEWVDDEWRRIDTDTHARIRELAECPCSRHTRVYFAAGDDGLLLKCERDITPGDDAATTCSTVVKGQQSSWTAAAGAPPVFVGTGGNLLFAPHNEYTAPRPIHYASGLDFVGVGDPENQGVLSPLGWVAVARSGELAVISRRTLSATVTHALSGTFYTLSSVLPDLFIVGDDGRVVHGVLRDFPLPRPTVR